MATKIFPFFFGSLLFFTSLSGYSQEHAVAAKITQNGRDVFGTSSVYIENVGQYGDTLAGYGYMGKIVGSYQGFDMPVLFTKKGMIYLHRESKLRTIQDIQKEERRAKRRGEKREKILYRDQVIIMEWLNANPNPELEFENAAAVTHSFGTLTRKARGFQKLLYKDLYPGIDVEYSFIPGSELGFEYKLLVHPGADPASVKMKYSGDVSQIKKDENGNLTIRSSIESIYQSSPLAFIEKTGDENRIDISFQNDKKIIGFRLPRSYDRSKLLIIDPFVTSTSTLTGPNTQKAKDIDFDYAGNIYVSGGGNASAQMLAKYDPSGTLLWTFSGSITTPPWQFGGNYGGWVVEKTTGSIYVGQGLTGGFRIIRLNSSGVYDNYITTANTNFSENWKMIYSCRAGSGTILAAGGGGNANNELALISPPGLVPGVSNISGLTGGHNDISDIVLDPLTDDMYTIFSTSVLTPAGDNIIYKHIPPHNAGNRVWSSPTGLFVLKEPANRPYIQGLDNSSNTLALNANYLFYWDGKNLKAFNKSDGTAAGAVLTIATFTALTQGGIYADECNNVFVGGANGIIKVYRFDGSVFDDNAAADLSITGFTGSVYDLAFDNGRKLLYASGNGFVASFDLSGYCPAQVYDVVVVTGCSTTNLTATINPAPTQGTTVTYVLYSGTTQLASNSTGVFPAQAPGAYSITAFLNQACGGPQTSVNFTIDPDPILVANDPAPICQPFTADLTNPAITAGSSSGLSFTYWSDIAASIPYPTPGNAPAGTYYIKAVNTSGCVKISAVNVTSKPAPVANAGPDKVICVKSDVQLQGSGGATYQWSPATYLSDPFIANPIVVQAPAGLHRYELRITDVNGCISVVPDAVTVRVQTTAKLYLPTDTAIVVNQPLQLNPIDVNGLGMINFIWTPATGLNNAFIQDPIAIIDRDIIYTVNANTAGGCPAMAQIRVTVYPVPDIFVPSAFTPNNDGLNDVLKAIPVGLKTFKYFRVYNRWGNVVFSTADPNKGWDGKLNAVAQNSGAFVWMAEGVDYTGKTLFRKGTSSIIR